MNSAAPLPDNIHLHDWIPQNDLLAHNKTKVFITHCGNNALIEAISHGVPVLAMPVHGDQFQNAARLIYRLKMGHIYEFKHLQEDTFKQAVNNLLRNYETYKTNAEKASELLKEQPMDKKDKFLFYVNHIIKHNGTDYLYQPALDNLNVFQIYSVDVIVVLTLISLIVTGIFIWFLLKCLKMCKRVAGWNSHVVNRDKKHQ